MTKFLLWLLPLFFVRERLSVEKIQINGTAQGTTYHITYYAASAVIEKREIDSILDKIDSSLSLYKPYSLICKFNASKDGVVADEHLKKVVNSALDTYKQTNGIFDITIYPLMFAWGFGPTKPDAPPEEEDIEKILPCVNSALLYWNNNKLMKRKPCIKLDANGIAQGYSVDVLAAYFEKKGVATYLVELGGEIRVKGRKPDSQEKMSVGIEAPGDDPGYSVIERVVWMDQGAITTSGNYRRYIESKGQKITHLLNPKTGRPIRNELLSVTVYAKDAMTADAYDNALMAMGLEQALAFVEKRNDMAAHFIYYKEGATVADTMSSRFRMLIDR
jgi:thiamine biosynthesis lipoprotein